MGVFQLLIMAYSHILQSSVLQVTTDHSQIVLYHLVADSHNKATTPSTDFKRKYAPTLKTQYIKDDDGGISC